MVSGREDEEFMKLGVQYYVAAQWDGSCVHVCCVTKRDLTDSKGGAGPTRRASSQRPFQKWATSGELVVADLQLTSAFPGSLRSSAGSTFRASASLPMIFKLA
jgi:hypothetical protein